MKKVLIFLGLFLLTAGVFTTCERIDAGHVGVEVDLYGSNRGVNGVTECSGMVFYNPITTKIYEFPTYIQHKEYSGENSFVINSKDGSEFHVSPILNYFVKPEKVPYIFAKYRRPLDDIENGFLKTAVYDAFRIAANEYAAEDLISHRQSFENRVRSLLVSQIGTQGFLLSQLTSNLEYPESFKKAIDAKNNAVQKALQAENRVKQAEAEAKIKVAQANGVAESTLIKARAEAEGNRLRQTTLTPMLLEQMRIEAWRAGG